MTPKTQRRSSAWKCCEGLSEILREHETQLVVSDISADIISAYVARRRGTISRAHKLLSYASINRELQSLRRALRVWELEIRLPAWDELMLPEADERVIDISHPLEATILCEMREDFHAAHYVRIARRQRTAPSS